MTRLNSVQYFAKYHSKIALLKLNGTTFLVADDIVLMINFMVVKLAKIYKLIILPLQY